MNLLNNFNEKHSPKIITTLSISNNWHSISTIMSDPPYASAPVHRPLENAPGAAALELPGGPYTGVIGKSHTNSIESNKSGNRVPSIANGVSSAMANRPIFNKV